MTRPAPHSGCTHAPSPVFPQREAPQITEKDNFSLRSIQKMSRARDATQRATKGPNERLQGRQGGPLGFNEEDPNLVSNPTAVPIFYSQAHRERIRRTADGRKKLRSHRGADAEEGGVTSTASDQGRERDAASIICSSPDFWGPTQGAIATPPQFSPPDEHAHLQLRRLSPMRNAPSRVALHWPPPLLRIS